MRSVFVNALLTSLLWCGLVLGSALLLDAFEFEATGACTDCLILPHLADRF